MKRNKHILILIVLLVLLVLIEYMAPKEPDWRPSFKKKDKIPFGTYIAFDLLKDAFPKSSIDESYKSIYQKLNEKEYQNTSLILITDRFSPNFVTIESLLKFVESGNKAFISADEFGKEFSDTLKFNSTVFYNQLFTGDSLPYNFSNPVLKSKSPYWFKSSWIKFYFDDLDTTNCKSIATIGDDKINCFRLPYGEGEFFIHNQPYAFTNYNILFKNNAEYTFKVFGYLKNNTVIWDESNKPGRNTATPLIYILEQKSLRSAYYIILAMGIIFMIFSAKRKQRIIPIVKPPVNSSLEFAKTLGNLYLSSRNHKDIAKKKFNYWLDFLRENYFIFIENPEELDALRISEKTGVGPEKIEKIINMKKFIDKAGNIGPEILMKFNQFIEDFYRYRK